MPMEEMVFNISIKLKTPNTYHHMFQPVVNTYLYRTFCHFQCHNDPIYWTDLPIHIVSD